MMDYMHDCSDCRYEFDCNVELDVECGEDCIDCEYSYQCSCCVYHTRHLESPEEV